MALRFTKEITTNVEQEPMPLAAVLSELALINSRR
jgi:hypothetical protein